jgi:hypothetical protein
MPSKSLRTVPKRDKTTTLSLHHFIRRMEIIFSFSARWMWRSCSSGLWSRTVWWIYAIVCVKNAVAIFTSFILWWWRQQFIPTLVALDAVEKKMGCWFCGESNPDLLILYTASPSTYRIKCSDRLRKAPHQDVSWYERTRQGWQCSIWPTWCRRQDSNTQSPNKAMANYP